MADWGNILQGVGGAGVEYGVAMNAREAAQQAQQEKLAAEQRAGEERQLSLLERAERMKMLRQQQELNFQKLHPEIAEAAEIDSRKKTVRRLLEIDPKFPLEAQEHIIATGKMPDWYGKPAPPKAPVKDEAKVAEYKFLFQSFIDQGLSPQKANEKARATVWPSKGGGMAGGDKVLERRRRAYQIADEINFKATGEHLTPDQGLKFWGVTPTSQIKDFKYPTDRKSTDQIEFSLYLIDQIKPVMDKVIENAGGMPEEEGPWWNRSKPGSIERMFDQRYHDYWYKKGVIPSQLMADYLQMVDQLKIVGASPYLGGIRNMKFIEQIQLHLPKSTDDPVLAKDKMDRLKKTLIAERNRVLAANGIKKEDWEKKMREANEVQEEGKPTAGVATLKDLEEEEPESPEE